MGNQVKNEAGAVDIQAVRAALLIPLVITVICSTFDMLFCIRLNMLELGSNEDVLFWVFKTLISYFFPSFFAAAVTLLWQYYFADVYSGVKAEKGLLLGISTLVYFFLYIIYLLYADTYYIIFFVIINLLYVWVVINKCIDDKILNKISTVPKGKAVNNSSWYEGR